MGLSGTASAADLKFLHHVPRVRLRNFKSKSGTRIIELLMPFGFRSSYSSVPRYITNFENRALVKPLFAFGNGHADLPGKLAYKFFLCDLVDAGEAKGQLVFDRIVGRLEAAQS